MQVLGSQNEKIALVCGVHGEEIFGLDVFKYFKSKLDKNSDIKLILANEKALKQEDRFIDKDLNRCFPGEEGGCHEEVLASKILQEINNPDYLLDIHTTFSKLEMSPIVVDMNDSIEKMLNLISYNKIAYIQPGINDSSLIGQFDAGVSLEFGHEYAQKNKNQALQMIEGLISGLLSHKTRKPKERGVYKVDGVIKKDFSFPENGENFKKLDNLDVYPFLFHERPGEDIYGLSASKVETLSI